MINDKLLLMNTGVILAGHDQSGKTTLAHRLCKMTGNGYIHYDPPQTVESWFDEYTKDIKDKATIIDRSYVCEMVYGPILRNENNITFEIQKQIEDFFNSKGYIFILCHRTNFSIKEFEDRKELCDFETILKIREKYLEVYETITLPKIIVDSFATPFAIMNIISLAKKTQRR